MKTNSSPIKIVYVDDDDDDHFIFFRNLKEIDNSIRLVSITESEKLMDYLLKNMEDLPDYIFLDLNMPKKNGSECLAEIKAHDQLKQIPVIIFSTCYHEDILGQLYKDGAAYAMRKSSSCEQTKKMIRYVLERNTFRKTINEFALTSV
jgi:response regulator RpfG family c-di-GMP phosphodiesterase